MRDARLFLPLVVLCVKPDFLVALNLIDRRAFARSGRPNEFEMLGLIKVGEARSGERQLSGSRRLPGLTPASLA